ncbi:MAG: hypothetical protein RRY22_04225 [Bacilli bacterium]
MKKSIEETQKWLLENRVNDYGEIDLNNLDFSDFNGNVCIEYMKVKRNLFQDLQEVQGFLFQSNQTVEKGLFQGLQKVQGELWQNHQKVEGVFVTQALTDDEEYKISEYGDNYIVKKAKKYTYEELKEKLGHDFEIVEKEENK